MKNVCRILYRKTRRSLSEERRRKAQEELVQSLLPLSSNYDRIASFFSMEEEIELLPFNQRLAQEKRLLLPRVEEGFLQFYEVRDLSWELLRTRGALFEPHPDLCKRATLGKRDLLLVPGLAFDRELGRLGYGKGHYDRFLAKHAWIDSIGIGFREQLSEKALPKTSWDQPVKKLLLF